MQKKVKMAILWIIILIAVDITTKVTAIFFLNSGPISVIPQFFTLKLLYNTGAAFSLFENARWFFVALTLPILIIGWRYYLQHIAISQWFFIGGVFFFAGTIGNFLERLFLGRVTDFLSFTFGSYNFAVFNLADSFLSISIILILYAVYLHEKGNGGIVHE
ncbi:lipoprotein signal peptidase [Erysipelotrichaceae bacterium]|nr:lipoprotein signal peptidase [Erysipelotrichaceae bacterium]